MTLSTQRQTFLSTVTAEFGEHRRLLKGDLSLPRVKVQEQADLIQGGGKLLQTLDGYIRDDCQAVIHLVGSRSCTKRAFLVKFPRASYHANAPLELVRRFVH